LNNLLPEKLCITKKHKLFLDERFGKRIEVQILEIIGNTDCCSLILRNTPQYFWINLKTTASKPITLVCT